MFPSSSSIVNNPSLIRNSSIKSYSIEYKKLWLFKIPQLLIERQFAPRTLRA